MSDLLIRAEGLTKAYGSKVALQDVDLSVGRGRIIGLLGPNGSGKTTMLNCISCFHPCDKGEITLNGTSLSRLGEEEIAKVRNEQLGFVFQDFMLLDGLTVFENVCVPKVIRGEDYQLMEEKAGRLLRLFGIEQIADKYPAEISGGQKQRTAVARSLMNDPLAILADEPTGNLDSRSSEAVIQAFIEAKKTLGATTLMVTHDTFSASYCDRVIMMKDGKVHSELINNGDRKAFLEKLLDVLRKLNGGENDDAA